MGVVAHWLVGLLIAQAGQGEAPAELPTASEEAAPAAVEVPAPPPAAPPLIEINADERRAVQILGQLATPDYDTMAAGIVAAERHKSSLFDAPLRAILKAKVPTPLRALAATALGALDWPAEVTDLQERIEALGRATFLPEAEVRLAAVAALGSYPTPEAQKVLRLKLTGTDDAADRAALSAALTAMRSPDALKRLAAWMGAPPAEGRLHGVPVSWGVALAGRRLLADPVAPGVGDTVQEIFAVRDTALVRPLVAFAARASVRTLRLRALEHMAAEPLPVDEPFLIALLADPSPEFRRAAVKGLGAHATPAAAEALCAYLLAETSPDLLRAAAASLRRHGLDTLAPAVTPALRLAKGYGLDLLAFLIRERQGPETVEGKLVAQARAPSDAGLEALVAEDPETRRRVLLPFLSGADVPDAERLAALHGLEGIRDPETVQAVLHLLGPLSTPEVIRAAGEALAREPDEPVVARVLAVVDQSPAPQREALDRIVAARSSVGAVALLADRIRREPEPRLVVALLEETVDRAEPELAAATATRLGLQEDLRIVGNVLYRVMRNPDPALAPRLQELVREGPAAEEGASEYAGPVPRSVDIELGQPLAGEAASALAWTVRHVALETLVLLPEPAASEGLRALVQDGLLAMPLRLRAIEALGSRGDRDDLQVLDGLAVAQDRELRGAAKNAMHLIAPELHAEWDQYGRIPLVVTSSVFGTTLLLLSTQIAEELSETGQAKRKVLLGIGGAALGASTSFLLTLKTDVSLGEAGYYTTLGTWGTLGGYSLARAAGLGTREKTGPLWAAIAGELAGVSVGAFTLRSARFSAGDVVLTNTTAASFGAGAVSLAYLLRMGGGTAGPADAFTLGGLAAVVPLAFLSPRLKLDDDQVFGLCTTLAYATWVGAFAPRAIVDHPETWDTLAGVGVGQAVGLGAGLLLSQVTTFDGETVAWATLGALSGAGLGGGIGLSDRKLSGRPTYALLEGGTLLGAGALAWLGPKLDFSATDVGLILMMSAGGAFTGARVPVEVAQGVNVAGVDESTRRRKKWGGGLVGGTVGLYAGLAGSQFVDLSGGELTMTAAGAAVLGTGGAGLSLLLPELGGGRDPNQFSNMFTAGAAIGAIGLGAYLAPKLRYEPADIALGLSTAGFGAFLGSWLPAYGTPEGAGQPRSERTGGAMIGGALGLIFAGTVSQFTDVDPARVLRVDFGTVAGTAFGSGLGLLLPSSATHDQGRRTTVALMQAGAVTGYALATVTERRSEYDWADRYHLALGASLGAWHGSLIPYLWRAPTDSVPNKERVGGVLVGLGVGGAATRLSLHFRRIDEEDVTEVGLFDLYATTLGYGLYGLVRADRQTRYALLDGVGILGLAAGELLAANTSYSGSDALLIGALTLVGGGAGAGLPYLVSDRRPDRDDRLAGAALSAGALGLMGLGVSQAIDYDVDDLPEVMLTSAIVGSGLWGLGRARLHSSERLRFGMGDAGLYAGLALGLIAAPRTAFSANDFWWTASGSLLGAWVGGLTPQLVYGQTTTNASRSGGAAAGAAAGALLTGTAMQWLDLPKDWVWAAASVSVATTLVSGGLSVLELPASPKHEALSMQLAAVGGVVAAGFLAPYTHPKVEDLGTTLAGGGLGAWFGAFAPAALSLDADHRAGGGAMAGAGLGMLLGYGATQVVDFDGYDNLETITWSAVGSAMGGGLGMMLDFDDARTATSLEVAGLTAWGLSLGLARQTRFEPQDSLLMTVAGMWGAWHGGFLGDALASGEGNVARQRGGGALLGFGTGVAGGALLSQLTDVPNDEWAEATVLMGAGNMIGAGTGYLLQLDAKPQTGLFELGGLGGIAAGLALAQHTRYSDGDIVLAGMGSIFGAVHGAMLRTIIEGDSNADGKASWGGALMGTGLGLAGGMALSQVVEADASDLVEIGLVTAAGDVAGFGAAIWLDLEERGMLSLVEAGGLGMAALTLVTAERTSFDSGDRMLTAYGALYGGWLGGWAPRMWDGHDLGGGGVLLGSSLGALGAGAVSQLVDYQLADVAEIAFGSTTASVFGAGMGLVLRPDGDLWVPFMEASGIVGTLAFGYFAPRTQYTTSDAVLGGLSAAYGLYQGAGLSYLAKADDSQVAGAMMAATSAGVIVGSYLGPYIHLSGTDVLMLTAGSAWGVWIGIWSAAAIDAAQKDATDRGVLSLGVGTTAVATDVTLIATSVAISKLVEMPPKQFAWISVGGGLGMVAGLLTSNLSGNKINSKVGIAAGSVGGLLVGTTVTSFFDWEPAERVAVVPPLDSKARWAPAWLPQVDVWFPSVAIGPAGDAEGLSGIAGSQVLLTVSGLLR